MSTKRSRLGRPPASSSIETRKRITDAARRSFAELGYEATTNRAIAEAAAVTAGAIYHYFDSKFDIYAAVYEEVSSQVRERFIAAQEGQTTFVAKIDAVMEAFHELNLEDNSIARFIGAARIDRQRLNTTLANLPEHFDGDVLFVRMIDEAIEAGEIRPEDREELRHFFRAVAVGLTDGISDNDAEHRHAIDGLRLVMAGRLASISSAQTP